MTPEDHQNEGFKVDLRRNLQNFWEMVRPYKASVALLLLIILILETSYLAERYFLKILVDEGTRFADGTLTQQAFVDVLLVLAAVYAGIVVMWGVLKFVRIHLLNRLDAKLIVDMKHRFFSHLLSLSHRFHASHKTGSMISRLSRGAGAIENLMDVVLFNFAPLVLMLAVAMAAVLTVSVEATLILFAMATAFVGYAWVLQRRMMDLNVVANARDDHEKGRMSDFLLNVESVKYFGKEKRVEEHYEKLTRSTMNAFVRMWDVFRYVDAGHAIILGVSALAVIAVTANDVVAGAATVGDLAFVFAVYTGLIGPLYGFVHGMRSFTRSMADFESLWEYEKHENDIKDRGGAKNLRIKEGRIVFDSVSFAYKKKKAIDQVSLTIEPDTKVALVGHSGSGKSTLIKLLYRLYDVDEGSIRIDGHDVRAVRQKSLREELSIVPQEAILFDDTLYNNVRFSNPRASEQKVMEALRFAQLDTVVENLPDGVHTVVGERGVKLSGGEKQRVSIARALLADKKVLVLDEATSALDSHTEHEIQQDLEQLMEGRTSIIIAHRLSTVMHADQIVVLDKGRIVQQGTHRELVEREGPYKELWELQQRGFVSAKST